MAFSSTGVLFAAAVDAGGAVDLFTLDTTTGAATTIGSLSATPTTDIAFSSTDILYAWNSSITNGGLMTVNTTTGAGTFVVSGFSAPTITSLTFDTNGDLLGAGLDLYRIDTATSATTLVGTVSGFSVRGMALAPVPEPGSLVLTLAALGGLLVARRKRRLLKS